MVMPTKAMGAPSSPHALWISLSIDLLRPIATLSPVGMKQESSARSSLALERRLHRKNIEHESLGQQVVDPGAGL